MGGVGKRVGAYVMRMTSLIRVCFIWNTKKKEKLKLVWLSYA